MTEGEVAMMEALADMWVALAQLADKVAELRVMADALSNRDFEKWERDL